MAGDNPDDFEKLTYRALAARLGISPDGARMRAKRKAKAGTWRIIPGNHPSDPVLVEVPIEELSGGERAGREHSLRSGGERIPRTNPDDRGNVLAEQALASLAEAQTRIQDLTDQLIKAKDAHSHDASALAAAQVRELAIEAELERARADVAVLRAQLARLQRPWWRRVWG